MVAVTQCDAPVPITAHYPHRTGTRPIEPLNKEQVEAVAVTLPRESGHG